MATKLNLVGQTFGRLLVISEAARSGKRNYERNWLCNCDCGNMTLVYQGSLTMGYTISCGCFHKEQTSNAKKDHGQSSNGRVTSEYTTWASIKARCYNKLNKSYKNYGGRGIKVCDRWLENFENFFEDMGVKPTPYHSLDRFPDTNGNYEKINCRWATSYEQSRNTTKNHWIEYDGNRMIIEDWGKFFKVSESAIRKHLNNGKSFNEIYLHYTTKNQNYGN